MRQIEFPIVLTSATYLNWELNSKFEFEIPVAVHMQRMRHLFLVIMAVFIGPSLRVSPPMRES